MSFTFSTCRSVVFQRGAAAQAGAQMSQIVGPRCLLIADPGLVAAGLHIPLKHSLTASGVEVVVFDALEPEPKASSVLAAAKMGQDAAVTGILGFGGGSSLDIAKIAALLIGGREPLEGLWGADRARGPRLPLVLVPTTAGTGSEVTPVAILTDADGLKRPINSQILLPDLALLDAELTLGLPAPITAATGLDAMVHAIESYASAHANNSVVTRSLAREALRQLGGNIETAVTQGQNIGAREAMLLGSWLAGLAFANAPVAAVHVLAYPVGAGYHQPHGVSIALMLPHVLRFNAASTPAPYAEIAPDVFPALGSIADLRERAAAFADDMAALIARIGLPTRLRDVGVPREALADMATQAMGSPRLLANNPRPLTQADAAALYEQAW